MIVETERDTTLNRLYAALVDVAISVGRAPIAIRNSRLYAPMLTYTIFEPYSIIYHVSMARLLSKTFIGKLCPTIDILPLMTNADGEMCEQLLPIIAIQKGPNGNHAVSSHNKLISHAIRWSRMETVTASGKMAVIEDTKVLVCITTLKPQA